MVMYYTKLAKVDGNGKAGMLEIIMLCIGLLSTHYTNGI
jgi:hypothetical protein